MKCCLGCFNTKFRAIICDVEGRAPTHRLRPRVYGGGRRADRHHDVPRWNAADRPTVLLQSESKTTTYVLLQWGRPSTATVPAVWNIKLHMPSGADSYPADTDAADTDAADADSTLARTDAARTDAARTDAARTDASAGQLLRRDGYRLQVCSRPTLSDHSDVPARHEAGRHCRTVLRHVQVFQELLILDL